MGPIAMVNLDLPHMVNVKLPDAFLATDRDTGSRQR